jgi:maleate cis-trans isomerase
MEDVTTTSRPRITVGVLTPHAAAGADVEFSHIASAYVRTEVSRIHPRSDPPTVPEDLRALATPAAINEAASALLPGVEVLAYASTSSGYAIGYDAESALRERLRERWNVPVHATSLSAVSALRSHHIERISLVHPPWFGHSLNELGAEYFRSQGFEVVDARLADLPTIRVKSSRPWSSSGLRSTSATTPKHSSLAATASKPIAPPTTWSAGPDASVWRRTRPYCGRSSKAPSHRWPPEGSGGCSAIGDLTGTIQGEIEHARRHSVHVDVIGWIRRQRP